MTLFYDEFNASALDAYYAHYHKYRLWYWLEAKIIKLFGRKPNN